MAKLARCEQCRREEPLDATFGQLPYGWVELRERRPGAEANREHGLCSYGCAAAWCAAYELARVGAERAKAGERDETRDRAAAALAWTPNPSIVAPMLASRPVRTEEGEL